MKIPILHAQQTRQPVFISVLIIGLLWILSGTETFAQNVFSGEPVQWVGSPNEYNTEPYNADYRTMSYRKIATTDNNPTDGRGQWTTTISVQNSGGNFTPVNMPGGAGNGWLLISGPSGNRFQNKWNFTGIGQGALNSINNVTLENGGEDMGLNMSTAGYYTFNMRDAGYANTEFYAGYTENSPVTLSRTGETLNTVTNGMTINITTSAAPSAGENVYVRYVLGTNDFSSGSAVIQAFGSGTSWSAEIPSQFCSTTVYYLVYTSTRTLNDIITDSESDRSLAAIRYDDNSGSNYSYTVSNVNILSSAGANGTITPPGNSSINCGDDVTFNITPNACYTIQDVVVDGISQGPVSTYTFNSVTGSHSISATFSASTFTIVASVNGIGSIPDPGPDPLAPCGSDRTYNIIPGACNSISDVLVDGISVGAVSSYTFTNIQANHTIQAIFVTTPYTITVNQAANGNISPGTGTVECGSNATYNITPDPCYSIQNVFVDGVPVGPVTAYTFTNVTAIHTITAVFELTTYSITATPGADGSITPAGSPVYNCGSSISYNIIPDACFHIVDVLVDGVSVGAVTSYTFSNINANHTISATFAFNATLSAPVISGPKNVCPFLGNNVQVTYTANAQGATNYNWILPPNVNLVSSTANSVTITFNIAFVAQANKQIRVTAVSPCGNSPLSILYLVTQSPGTASAIAGPTSVCSIIGTNNAATYTINAVPGAATYTWTAPAGAVIQPHTPGANDTTISVIYNTGFSSGSITVQALNGCGSGNVRSLAITAPVPSTPSPISGPTNVCSYIAPTGTEVTYTVTNIAGMSYNWILPSGAIGASGQGTNSISFTFPSGFVSGTISVTATNGCGTSGVRSISVTRLLPSAPGGITAVETQGCPDRIVHYSIPSMPANSTVILWIVPTSAGAVLVSGQGTTAIDVSYPPNAVVGVVSATSINDCGNSAVRSINVNLTDCGGGPPPPPGPRTARGNTTTNVNAAETMEVKLYPNPAVNDFRLQVLTTTTEKIKVRITDMQGRTVKTLIVAANQATTLGSDLAPGTYIVEAIQGSSVKTCKLVKF